MSIHFTKFMKFHNGDAMMSVVQKEDKLSKHLPLQALFSKVKHIQTSSYDNSLIFPALSTRHFLWAHSCKSPIVLSHPLWLSLTWQTLQGLVSAPGFYLPMPERELFLHRKQGRESNIYQYTTWKIPPSQRKKLRPKYPLQLILI